MRELTLSPVNSEVDLGDVLLQPQTVWQMTIIQPTLVTERGLHSLHARLDGLQSALERAQYEVNEAQSGSGDSEGLMAVEAIATLNAVQADIRRVTRDIASVVVVEGSSDTITPGVMVVVDFGDGPEEYCFGSIAEATKDIEVLTPDSPIGQALLGRRASDVVDVMLGSTAAQVTIISVS